jgi:hypothetical protein
VRSAASALVVASLLLGAGCGGDGDDGDGGGGAKARTATTESSGPVDRKQLESCLAKADLELRSGDQPFTDAKGQTKTRQDAHLEGGRYAGYVQWPSKRVADVYIASGATAATTAEREAEAFVRAFGLAPATYVQRHGNVVLLFDNPVPTEDEVAAVAGCA